MEKQVKTVQPPRLYDLTTLQRECNRIYGYTAQQTLDYVQSLYEKKLATYPRTDSQYLTEDMQATAASLVLWLRDYMPFGKGCTGEPDIDRASSTAPRFPTITRLSLRWRLPGRIYRSFPPGNGMY